MKRITLLLLVLGRLSGFSSAEVVEAVHASLPPFSSVAEYQKSLHPLPQSALDQYMTGLGAGVVYDVFAGENDTLKSAFGDCACKGDLAATGFETHLSGAALFGSVQPDAGRYAHLGAVTSVDALAVRLLLDLSGMVPGDVAWVVDPTGPRAFGPYTAATPGSDSLWSPTVEGDTAVLLVQSARSAAPAATVTGMSHFFTGFGDYLLKQTAQLPCHVNIECETQGIAQSVSSGVGVMVIPSGGFDQALCSGTLVNNPDTPWFEPYFFTANHCVDSQTMAASVDVIWDYRATECGKDDPPSLASLPRSSGVTLLTTNANLDLTLIELDDAPSGAFGRTFAGYTTRAITVGEAVTGMHHPNGSHMRISYGLVRETGVYRPLSYFNQIDVLWSQGVTENGSSGSGLFLDNGTFQIIGALSNGPQHSCFDTSNNHDFYGSLKNFYPQAQSWLSGTTPGTPGEPASGGVCPAKAVFNGEPEVLDNLRAFRDKVMPVLPGGHAVRTAYYAAAPHLTRWVTASPLAAATFRSASMPVAWAGSLAG